jgi:tetratricopeptide (TPR) repeat protein
MRATTIKRLGILIAVLVLAGGALFWIHRVQLDRMTHVVVKQAEVADQEGDVLNAERLYREYLEVMPDDLGVRVKHGAALLKVGSTPTRQAQAREIYSEVVKEDPGREDAHRRLMELDMEMGRFAEARNELSILLKIGANEKDGNLLFRMGQCCEKTGDESNALLYYRRAIECSAPERVEAYGRCATLLQEAGQAKEAEETIEKLVQSDPKNYQVYLERGRYRHRFGDPKDVLNDLRRATELAPGKPEVYKELAQATEQGAVPKGSGRAAARRILEDGLKAAPGSAELYEALADLEWRGGAVDKAIETLELGLKSMPDESKLRLVLAHILAQRGDTGKLALQIRELERIGYSSVFLQYLKAYYQVNSQQYALAKQLLVPLLAEPLLAAAGQHPFKGELNLLLARCYRQLGEPEMEQDALLRALSSNPNDMRAKGSYIASQVNQGNLDGAIQGYQELIGQAPKARTALVGLLITKNRRLPVAQRNWAEVDRLIEAIKRDEPDSFVPVILQADVLVAQDKAAQAEAELRKAHSQFPRSVELWNAHANLIRLQGRVDAALSVLDEAQRQLGDRVELRLQRAQLWATKQGPEVITVINGLAQNTQGFSKEDRHKLLDGLAVELARRQDLQGARRLWSQLAEEEPTNIRVRQVLLDLAFQTADLASKGEIEKYIKQIEEIEGGEGMLGRYCQARYLIWQARLAQDKSTQEALRTSARVLLSELRSRREDWAVLFLALAELDEQELAQGGLDQKQKRDKQESIANSYLRAIDLGQREPAIARRAVELLFELGRSSDAMQLASKIPTGSQLAAQVALREGDYPRAEELARKAVVANPTNIQERRWLVQILVARQKFSDAETELREVVNLDKSDPDRWIALVELLRLSKQPEKAEKAVREAEANLPQPKGLLALAHCSDLVGQAYAAEAKDDLKLKWYSEARKWYEKARAAQPDDLLVARRFTQFFLSTGQVGEAESALEAILKSAGAKNPALATWARRNLALTLASGTDPEKVRRALALMESSGRDQTGGAGQASKTLEDPEDLRVLVRVLDAQKTPTARGRAVRILESLVARNLANPQDRLWLARFLEASGDWPKAREQYRELVLRSENARDQEILKQRPMYVAEFANRLLRHRETKDNGDLVEAQTMVGKLKQLQPTALGTLRLEIELYRAENQIQKAENVVRDHAGRKDLLPAGCKALAELAEESGWLELAQELYQRFAEMSESLEGKVVLAEFLGRHGHVKDAVDLCEPLWSTTREPKEITAVADACLKALFGPRSTPEAVQMERVAQRLERALKNGPRSTTLIMALGNVRERQGHYKDAEDLYREVIKQGDRRGVSYNNLAWLVALSDRKGSEALKYINEAITLQGPSGVYLPDFLDTRAVVYLIAGEPRRAIIDLEKAIQAAPSPSKYFHLGQAYLADHNKEKAKQNLELAKTKGLALRDLHPLEQPIYQKVLSELGM